MTDLQTAEVFSSAAGDNPLLRDWTTPFGAPPFPEITEEHYRPAFDIALAEHDREIAAIATSSAEPTFENTVDALELSGAALRKVSAVFFNLSGSHTSEVLQKIEREIAPVLAKHHSAIFRNEPLFRRVDALKTNQGTLTLSAEQGRVLERLHLAFVRQGAALPREKKQRLAEIAERLS